MFPIFQVFYAFHLGTTVYTVKYIRYRFWWFLNQPSYYFWFFGWKILLDDRCDLLLIKSAVFNENWNERPLDEDGQPTVTLTIGVCRIPMYSTRPVFRNQQFEHCELQRTLCQCDAMMLRRSKETGVYVVMLWRQMETGVCKHKKDFKDTSNLWLTVFFSFD